MTKSNTKSEQSSLSAARTGAAMVAVPGSEAHLTKPQRDFNKLTAQLHRLRERVSAWEAYVPRYALRVHAELEPVLAAIRGVQRRLAHRIDALLNHADIARSLSRKHRLKLRSLLKRVVQNVLGDGPDAELEALHDKHSDISNEDQRRMDIRYAEAMAASVLGAGAVEGHGAKTVDELFAHLHEQASAQAQAEARAHEAHLAAQAAKRGRPTRAQLDAERRAQAAKEANASVREIYRKLVSTLHPDREIDLAEHARKTELMQRANQAYERNDVLGLLSLQLEIEQIDPDHLATVPDARIKHYNQVLRDQIVELQLKVARFEVQFANEIDTEFLVRNPQAADTAFAKKVAEAKSVRRAIERDLQWLDDPHKRRALLDSLDDEQDDIELLHPQEFEAMFSAEPTRNNRKRRPNK